MALDASVFVGVISGVITSVIIFIAAAIFNKVVVPWYRAAIYRGLDISGTWKDEVNHGGATDYSVLSLKQREQHISGTITIVKTDNETQEKATKLLDLNGSFQDGTLMLIANSRNKKVISHATYLLRAVRGGSTLSGLSTWVDIGTGRVEHRHCAVTRAET